MSNERDQVDSHPRVDAQNLEVAAAEAQARAAEVQAAAAEAQARAAEAQARATEAHTEESEARTVEVGREASASAEDSATAEAGWDIPQGLGGDSDGEVGQPPRE